MDQQQSAAEAAKLSTENDSENDPENGGDDGADADGATEEHETD
jgi:hypothetical protein